MIIFFLSYVYMPRRRRPRRRPRKKARKYAVYRTPRVSQHAFKLRVTAELTTDANGYVNCIIQPHSLSSFYENSVGSLTPLLEEQALGNLFDTYKVTGVKMDFIPYFPNGWSLGTNSTAASGEFVRMPQLLVSYDVDNAGKIATTDYDTLLQKDFCKQFQPNKRFRRYIRLQANKQVNLQGATIQVQGTGGWMNMQDEGQKVAGNITIMSDAPFRLDQSGVVGANFAVGKILFTSYVKCKNRK